MSEGKYSVELFKEGGEGAGQEEIIDRYDNLTVARAIYRGRVAQYSGRPIMLRDCLRNCIEQSPAQTKSDYSQDALRAERGEAATHSGARSFL